LRLVRQTASVQKVFCGIGSKQTVMMKCREMQRKYYKALLRETGVALGTGVPAKYLKAQQGSQPGMIP